MRIRASLVGFLTLAFVGAMSTRALIAADLDQVNKRLEERFPKLQELKRAGKLGETSLGLVEAVKAEYTNDPGTRTLMMDENSDRQELYQIVAAKTGARPEDVAQRLAARRFQRAEVGEFLKMQDGKWVQKKK